MRKHRTNRQNYTKERRQYLMDTLTKNYGAKNADATPQAYLMIRHKLEKLQAEHKRLSIMMESYLSPQSVVVVEIAKIYDRFALCYSTNRLSGVKIPYTLNYSMLLSRGSKDDVRVEHGKPLK